MPQYYSTDLDGMGEIIISAHPWWRRIWPFRNYFPYFVGDRVWFNLKIQFPISNYLLYEIFNGNDYNRELDLVPQRLVVGDRISKEGDVEYRIGLRGAPKEGATIFTAHVINRDKVALGCVSILIGAIVTITTGIILGFIDVVRFWKIWIP